MRNHKTHRKGPSNALFAVEPLRGENCEALNHLISEFTKNLLMLNKIGEQPANWSTILVYMMCSRLDSSMLRNWETHNNSKDIEKLDNLMLFLRGPVSAQCCSQLLLPKFTTSTNAFRLGSQGHTRRPSPSGGACFLEIRTTCRSGAASCRT